MNRARHLRNYDMHSWTGIALGFFVFIVSLSGCFALFHEELHTWEDASRRLPTVESSISIGPIYEDFVAEVSEGKTITSTSIDTPNELEPYFSGYVYMQDEDGKFESESRRWDPATGDILPERAEGAAYWLLVFHQDLMWPDALGGRTAGRSLVGVAGVILMLALISGVVAHTKIFEELFTLRYWRSVRLKWQDTHKVVGLWGLPFFAMISFTGAILGIVAILAPITAVVAFKGNTEALIEKVIGTPPQAIGVEAEMLPLDDFIQKAHPESGEIPGRIIVSHYGDEAATYNLLYRADSKLTTYESETFSAVTGEQVYNRQFDASSPGSRVTGAISPLHYGTYGGEHGSVGSIGLKLVYFILGLALAIITAMGNMMWIERRLHGNDGSKSEAFYRRLSKLNVGLTTAMGFASISVLYVDKLYGGVEASRMFWVGWTYFAVWIGFIIYALCRENEYRTTREILALTGFAAMGVPLLNGVVTADPFWLALFSGHRASAWVDVICLLAGTLTCLVAWRLPDTRPEKKKVRKKKLPLDAQEEDVALAPAE